MDDKSTQSPDPTYNSSPELWQKLKPLAREKRHNPTLAENALWQRLRGRKVENAKFRRQHSIGRFIVDFMCVQAKLVIEVDGEIHQYTQEEDKVRQAFIEAQGLTVIRFKNDDVMQNIELVIQTIAEHLDTGQSD